MVREYRLASSGNIFEARRILLFSAVYLVVALGQSLCYVAEA